jgi:CHASE2 domain-containing sensor protein
MEVPIIIWHKGLEKTSKKSPVSHGGEVVATLLSLFIEEKPLIYLVIPGAILITIALTTGAHLLILFNATRYFSIPIALITLGALFTGMILFITALILYAITRLARKHNRA